MAITLTQARQYAQRVQGANGADAPANLLYLHWIQEALERLWAAYGWKWFRASQRLSLDVEEGDDDLTVTQDGTTFVRAAITWPAKYASEAWDVLVAADPTLAFQIASISTVTGTLATGQKWLLASGSSKVWVGTRWRYSLPTNLRDLDRVEVLGGSFKLAPRTPEEMDALRNAYPHQRGSVPEFYTVRGQYLEIWPALGTTRRALQLTYKRGVTLPAEGDAGSTELDWPDQYVGLLKKAIRLEGALRPDPQVDYVLAEREYKRALADAIVLDGKKVERRHGLSLRPSRARERRPFYLGELPDDDGS